MGVRHTLLHRPPPLSQQRLPGRFLHYSSRYELSLLRLALVGLPVFDTYKTVLNADKLYLQDDESVFGHVFIAFLSLYIHCKQEQLLKKAKLNHKITAIASFLLSGVSA